MEEELMFRECFVLLRGVNDALGAFLESGLELISW
jgi:hypothetical protein